MRKFVWIGALSALVLFTQSKAHAAFMLIDAGPASNSQSFSGGNYVAGTEFTTASPLTIRSLAWLDVEGDGLAQSHAVGLWSASTQNLLASVTVLPTSSTQLSAQGTAVWYLEDIAPLTLAPGTYRVAGEVGPNSHLALSNNKIGNGVTLSAGYVRTDFPNGGFNYPNLTFSSEAVRASLSSDSVAEVSAVPLSPTILVFALGGVGMFSARARRSNFAARPVVSN